MYIFIKKLSVSNCKKIEDILLLVKHIKLTYKCLISFDKNIKFTVDNFSDGNDHFLDIQIDENHTSIYYKPTDTHIFIVRHMAHKNSMDKSFIPSSYKICSTNVAFNEQIKSIKKLVS